MTRAFHTEPHFSNGTDKGEFRLLEHIENKHVSRNITYEKQMQKLRANVAKSVLNVQKWKLTVEERNAVSYHAEMAEQAGNADTLAEAINGLLEATHRLKER